jgi:hypothetical protein
MASRDTIRLVERIVGIAENTICRVTEGMAVADLTLTAPNSHLNKHSHIQFIHIIFMNIVL